MSALLLDPRRMAAAEVGGKFHTQARMQQAGIAVPAFFCVPAAVFRAHLQPLQPRVAEILAGLDHADRKALAAAAEALRTLVRSIALEPALQAAIAQAHARELAGAAHVSVRASMLATRAEHSEDSVSNPFAGISESFLYVRPETIADRIRDCWASAFAEKALLYRLTQGIDPLDVAVAVGVQRMVFGTRSFVMFTCDPNNCARDTLLVAGHGIGEGVVQEAVPVDHYFVGGKSGLVESRLAHKDRQLGFDTARGEGLCAQPVEPALRDTSCLAEAEVRALRELGTRIEALFGWPQDIEGTIDAQGQIHILQARPVAIDYTTRRVWTGLNVTESYPGVSSPLTYTLARLFYRVIFHDIYRRAGVAPAVLHDAHHRLDRMIGYVHGRIYYSLNAFYLLHGLAPIFPILCKAWENMVGLKSSYFIASGEAEPPPRGWAKFRAQAGGWALFLREFVRLPQRMRDYKQWWRARAVQARAVLAAQPDALALTEEFHRLWRDVGRHWGVTLVNDAYIFTLMALVNALFRRWRLDRDAGLLASLLCGDEGIESVEVFLSVLRIAACIREDAALAASFRDSDDAALLARYRAGAFPERLQALLAEHIRRYGDRSMEELKMENPSLREDPTVLLRGVRRFIDSDLDAERCREAELAKRAEGERALDARFGRFSPRKALLRAMLKLLREVIAHRENARYCRSELFGICRDLFYAQAAHLVQHGAIAEVGDVIYLTVDELCGYTDGTGVDESFHETVARRRAQLIRYAEDEVPETLATDGALRSNRLTRPQLAAMAGGSLLQGLGSSMGVVRGRAHVVSDPNAVEALPPDSILVARETDPGWLFLMLAASGIVVERGSMLSHTAITGRKFGIPTVVGVESACARIPHGAWLEIDGGAGTVRILEA